jgi:hypothetical protein
MKWKADLPKMPRLPKIRVDPGDPTPDALGPPPAPCAYRAQNPVESKPAEYQAPSMLVEHRGLALLFIVAALGFAVYCWRGPRGARTVEPLAPIAASVPGSDSARARAAAPTPSQSPIYVEAIPDK